MAQSVASGKERLPNVRRSGNSRTHLENLAQLLEEPPLFFLQPECPKAVALLFVCHFVDGWSEDD